MTYQDDPNPNMNRTDDQDTNWMAWLIGGVVALAVILGIFLMAGPTGNDNTAANNPRTTTTAPPPASVPPATTGSGVPTAPTAR
jgi:hypothetical protein